MTSRDLQTLYAYHYWAVRRVLATSAQVSDEQDGFMTIQIPRS